MKKNKQATIMRISKDILLDLWAMKQYKMKGKKRVLESYSDVIMRLIEKHK